MKKELKKFRMEKIAGTKLILLLAAILVITYAGSILVKSDENKISVIVEVENKTIEKNFWEIKLGEERIDREKVIAEIGKENVIHQFSSSEAFSAELTEKQLENLDKVKFK